MQNYDYEIKMKKINCLKRVGLVPLLFLRAFFLSFCLATSGRLCMEMCEKKHIFVTTFPTSEGSDHEFK